MGISFITLKRWIYSGRIRAVRTPSGRWMIPESEVDRIIGGGAEITEMRATTSTQHVKTLLRELRASSN